MGKGVKVRLLYVDTEKGCTGSVWSTYNAFQRAWKRLRD
jgi:hypothetical protein